MKLEGTILVGVDAEVDVDLVVVDVTILFVVNWFVVLPIEVVVDKGLFVVMQGGHVGHVLFLDISIWKGPRPDFSKADWMTFSITDEFILVVSMMVNW